MYSFTKKRFMLKEPLKQLNKLEFSHIASRSASADQELKDVPSLLHDNPNNIEMQIKVSELRAKAYRLAEAEKSVFSQQAKRKFTINSDRCTKMFHAIMRRNRARNNVPAILKKDGSWTSSQVEV